MRFVFQAVTKQRLCKASVAPWGTAAAGLIFS
jgi:hypothetical protein